MSLLGNLRNKAVEAFVKNHELVKRFGDVQSVSIDSDNGTADVSVLLHGEIFPIKFRGYYYFDDTAANASGSTRRFRTGSKARLCATTSPDSPAASRRLSSKIAHSSFHI